MIQEQKQNIRDAVLIAKETEREDILEQAKVYEKYEKRDLEALTTAKVKQELELIYKDLREKVIKPAEERREEFWRSSKDKIFAVRQRCYSKLVNEKGLDLCVKMGLKHAWWAGDGREIDEEIGIRVAEQCASLLTYAFLRQEFDAIRVVMKQFSNWTEIESKSITELLNALIPAIVYAETSRKITSPLCLVVDMLQKANETDLNLVATVDTTGQIDPDLRSGPIKFSVTDSKASDAVMTKVRQFFAPPKLLPVLETMETKLITEPVSTWSLANESSISCSCYNFISRLVSWVSSKESNSIAPAPAAAAAASSRASDSASKPSDSEPKAPPVDHFATIVKDHPSLSKLDTKDNFDAIKSLKNVCRGGDSSIQNAIMEFIISECGPNNAGVLDGKVGANYTTNAFFASLCKSNSNLLA